MKPPSSGQVPLAQRGSAIVTDAITPEGEPDMGREKSSRDFMKKRGTEGKCRAMVNLVQRNALCAHNLLLLGGIYVVFLINKSDIMLINATLQINQWILDRWDSKEGGSPAFMLLVITLISQIVSQTGFSSF